MREESDQSLSESKIEPLKSKRNKKSRFLKNYEHLENRKMNSLSTSIDSVLDDDHAFIASDDHVKVHSVDLKGTFQSILAGTFLTKSEV